MVSRPPPNSALERTRREAAALMVKRLWQRAHRPLPTRRRAIVAVLGASLAVHALRGNGASSPPESDLRWYEAAVSMKRLAESWGDQPYGAVVVLAGELVGEGPSRVVKNQDPRAHAEYEAIRDAQRRLGRPHLSGAVLYSTSRPCGWCEAVAAEAGVARMVFGPSLTDAGKPRIAK